MRHIEILLNNIAQMYSIPIRADRQLQKKNAKLITLQFLLSVGTSPSGSTIEQLIDTSMNQTDDVFYRVWKEAFARKAPSNFPSLDFDPGQIRKQKSGGSLVKHAGFHRHSSPAGRLPALLKGISSKPLTLAILLPIKIYWKHPGNTVRLILLRIACQKPNK